MPVFSIVGSWGQVKWFIRPHWSQAEIHESKFISLHSQSWAWAQHHNSTCVALNTFFLFGPHFWWQQKRSTWPGRLVSARCQHELKASYLNHWVFVSTSGNQDVVRFKGTCSLRVRAWKARKSSGKRAHPGSVDPRFCVQPLWCGFFLPASPVKFSSHILTWLWFTSVTGTF